MSRYRSIPLAVLAGAIALLAACGGAGESGAPPRPGAEGAAGVSIPEPTGPIDEALAERGEQLFRQKGCIACHTVGKGRLTGPDLARIGERRDWRWIVRMVTNPDSMTRHDPTAKRLLDEYATPMPNLGIQPDEVRALYEHIRGQTAEAGGKGS